MKPVTKNLAFMKFLPWFVGVAAALAYILPWVLAGESGYVRIHDTLDSNLVWHKIMAEQKFWFAPNLSEVGPIFEKGAPRISYPSELSAITLLFAWLEPYWAYVANQLILRLVAFSGMYIFLRSILLAGQKSHIFIALGVALCYAALPYYAFGGGAIAGLSWVFYALIRIWRGYLGIAEVIVLFAYPFYSHILLTGMYLIGLIWLLIPIAIIFGHRARPILVAAIITTVSHLLVSYRLVEFAVVGGFIPHRADFVRPHNSLAVAWSETMRIFQYGEWAVTLHGLVIFYTVLAVLLLAIIHCIWRLYTERNISNRIESPWWRSHDFTLGFLVAICFGISFFCGFWDWDPITSWRETIPILIRVNFTRISFFLPFIWMVAFALALVMVSRTHRLAGYLLVPILLFTQFAYEWKEHEYFTEKKMTGITFSQFFSQSIFDDIEKSLPADKSSYVVGSIGIHPSVAQFNGFRTADGYLNLYPLEYKNKFRNAIAREFSKREDLIRFFDIWGSAAYFFTAEVWCPRDGAVCVRTSPVIEQLDFDVPAMKALGVRYLFSVPTIKNAQDMGLKKIGVFEDQGSAWKITVYELPNDAP